MRFQCGSELRALGFLHRDEVLDAQRVQRLATEALGHDAGADAFARGIHRSTGTSRAAADDQHVVRRLGRQLGCITRSAAGVDLGQDFGQLHAAGAERLAVQKHHRHGHDLARVDLGLVQRAIHRGVAHTRVEHRHQVQRLHNVGAVVASQGHVGLEVQLGVALGVQRPNLVDQLGIDLGRVAASLQQRQHQRRELVTHRDGRKAQAHVFTGPRDLKRRAPRVVAVETRTDFVVQLGDLDQQRPHLFRCGALVQAGDQLDRVLQALKVGLELGLNGGVEHGRLQPSRRR